MIAPRLSTVKVQVIPALQGRKSRYQIESSTVKYFVEKEANRAWRAPVSSDFDEKRQEHTSEEGTRRGDSHKS